MYWPHTFAKELVTAPKTRRTVIVSKVNVWMAAKTRRSSLEQQHTTHRVTVHLNFFSVKIEDGINVDSVPQAPYSVPNPVKVFLSIGVVNTFDHINRCCFLQDDMSNHCIEPFSPSYRHYYSYAVLAGVCIVR
ncbi:hypothetical protein M378DRAFT_326456 [Amanita muscaria Koide BX008]|uniref:Uncharacterized protein n=1 Tax=Amanita muscaria (strain Koide BX008) TaxID=946122 RepID=A0A0C2XCG6_AMAMK|nr:hypothetical protein M378DRAFT_326456 [Amanita muscaria Koide BX008]